MFPLLYDMVLTFESVSEIEECDYSNETHWAVLFCGAIYYALRGNFNCRDGGQENQNTTRKEIHKWTISKVTGLAAHAILAEEFTACVASAGFAISIKTNQKKLTGATQSQRVYLIIISFFSHSGTSSLREFLLLEYAASLMSNHRWELLLLAVADMTLTFLRS